MIKILGFLTVILCLSGNANAMESDTIKGVISYVNHDRKTITVSNEQGRRHTYFVGDDTRYRAGEKNISFNDVKRGQNISATLRHTDTGPELVFFEVEALDELVELIPVALNKEIIFSGKVTGVRAQHGTLTIRDAVSRDRHTFNVNDDTSIHQSNGSPLNLSQIQRGDEVTLRYHQTEEGLIVITVLLPAGSLAAVLPKTASSNYMYLALALGFASLGSTLWCRRRWTFQRGS